MTFITLFLEFFKTGLFSVGGGLATLPFLYELSDKYPQWFTRADLSNMIAVSESTPGPIGVNMATFAGFQAGGVPGSVVAVFGLVLPSFIIILLVAGALTKFSENFYVKASFYGLRPVVTGLIASAGFGILLNSVFHTDSVFTLFSEGRFDIIATVTIAIFVTMMNIKKIKLHPVVYIAVGAALGIVLKLG